jgi:hypothetical protein
LQKVFPVFVKIWNFNTEIVKDHGKTTFPVFKMHLFFVVMGINPFLVPLCEIRNDNSINICFDYDKMVDYC